MEVRTSIGFRLNFIAPRARLGIQPDGFVNCEPGEEVR